MIELTDKELRRIDSEFRTRASRVMRIQFRDAVGTLRQFLDYVESVPLLRDYVGSCKLPIPETELVEDINAVAGGHGRAQFRFASTTEGELAQAYFILKRCCAEEDKSADLILGLGMAYNSSSDTRFQSYVEAFVNAIAHRFIEDVNLYLHSLTMNIKTDMERSYHIQNNGGQVVIANDNSTVTASQSNVAGDAHFSQLKDSVLNAAKESGATAEQIAEIRDILSEIEKQIKDGKPKKSLLVSFFAGLDKIAGTIANGTVLIEKIGAFAAFVWDKCKDLIQ